MCVQEKMSNGTVADWQLIELSADDVRDDDDDDVNSITAGESVTSPGVRHLLYTLTGLTANTSYAGYLRATNIFGSSDWSSKFSFKTAVQSMFIKIKIKIIIIIIIIMALSWTNHGATVVMIWLQQQKG